MFWGMLETGVAIVAICLPILYRIVRDVSPGARLHSLLTFRQLRGSKDDDSSSLEGAKVGPEAGSTPRRFRGVGSLLKCGGWWEEKSHGEGNGPGMKAKGMASDSSTEMKLSLGFKRERGTEEPQPGNESTVALPKLMHPVVTADVVLNAQQHSPRSQMWEMKEIQRTVEVV